MLPDPSSTVVSKTFQYLQTSYRCLTFIPSSLVGLSASVFHEGDRTYIAGMDLICADSSVISVRHRLPLGNTQVHTGMNQPSLQGFKVAIGSGGFRALRPIAIDSDSGSPTWSWLGIFHDLEIYNFSHCRCDTACITTRLVLDGNIDALEFTFDVSSLSTIYYHPIQIANILIAISTDPPHTRQKESSYRGPT